MEADLLRAQSLRMDGWFKNTLLKINSMLML